MSERKRCDWSTNDPLYVAYHDEEWGVPVTDEIKLFEMIVLDGAQAGLSWLTILKKRDNYRKAFKGFDPVNVARYTSRDVDRLLKNTGIIRNRLKIESAVKNARAFLKAQEEHGSFASLIWRYVDCRPIQNRWEKMSQIPATTKVSDAMSKDLKNMGFSFVGSTICYAFMQAAGLVNDHTVDCFRYNLVKRMGKKIKL